MMRVVWFILYNLIAIPLMWTAFHIIALHDPKVRQGIKGRRSLFRNLSAELTALHEKKYRFWIHNSSMGEFEQSRPLIHALKSRYPECLIIVTFFSPSGKEHVKSLYGADIVTYMPFDSFLQARRFVRLMRPTAALVIRHEFWPNHLCRLNREGVPAFLVNASIRHTKSFRYPPVLSLQRFFYSCFDMVLTVSQETLDFLERYHLHHGLKSLTGDTRYDQVVQRAKEAEAIVAPLRALKKNRQCLIAGSTWPSDEAILFPVLARLKSDRLLPWIVLVPHEPTENHLSQAEEALHHLDLTTSRFSQIGETAAAGCDVLLVDRIGILASLYALGNIAFVGGGFGPGVHQVLEPAAFGLAVFYGPRSTNSYEAEQLRKRGVGFVVNHADPFYDLLSNFLRKPQEMEALGRKAATLVNENRGASERIVDAIAQVLSP